MKRVLNRPRAGCNSCSHYCVHTLSSYYSLNIEKVDFHYVPDSHITTLFIFRSHLFFIILYNLELNNFDTTGNKIREIFDVKKFDI